MLILKVVLFLALSSSANLQHDGIMFHLSSFGMAFEPGNSSHRISIQSGISSMNRCAMACLIDTECLTVDYDSSSFLGRLFTTWAYEGTVIQSAALSTSNVGYIEKTLALYFLYGQSCNVSNATNRFLSCSFGRWSCPVRKYFNGSVCRSNIGLIFTTYQDSPDRKGETTLDLRKMFVFSSRA